MRIMRIIAAVAVALVLIPLLPQESLAEGVFEYYFIPGESESPESEATEEFGVFLDSLPHEIKSRLPEEMFSGDLGDMADAATKMTDFGEIVRNLMATLTDALIPSVRQAAAILGIVLLAAVFRVLKNSIGAPSAEGIVETVITVAAALSIVGTELISVNLIEGFKELICGLMNGIIPIIGAMFAVSGNAGTAAIQSGGIMMLVTLCQNLFAGILMPSVRVCLILSLVGAVFKDVGVKPITVAFRNLSTWIMAASVTLFSFVLGLQNTIAQSADSFGIRSIKFAVGNLVPIIGGAVSDSLGTVGGSLTLLKSAGGAATIVIVVILLAPTLFTLVAHRFTLFLCKSVAGILGCTAEESLLGDMGTVASMMLAFAAAMSVAFVYALTLFTGATLAIGG